MWRTVFHVIMVQNYINPKQKTVKKEPHPLRLGNISKDFIVYNMTKIVLQGYMHNFSVCHDTIESSDAVHIHNYLMKCHNII